MIPRKLHFQKLHLTRSPGLPDGVKELTELSPQINVVRGPNASGKSSLARAVQVLLWGDADAGTTGFEGGRNGGSGGSGDGRSAGNSGGRSGGSGKSSGRSSGRGNGQGAGRGEANHLVMAAAELQILSDDPQTPDTDTSSDPDTTRSAEVDVTRSAHAQNWMITLQPSGRMVRRDGSEQELPLMPSPSVSSNYMLSLQDLISGDENGLAAHIRREAIGGYDLTSIPNNLDYSDKISRANISEAKMAKEAVLAVEARLKDQKKLVVRQKNLENLEIAKKEAKKADVHLEVLERILQICEKNHEIEAHQEKKAAYPETMSHLRDDDAESFKELEAKQNACRTDLANQETNEQNWSRKVQSFGFPEAGLDRDKIRMLEGLAGNLEKLSKEIDRTQAECSRLDGEMKAYFEQPDPNWIEEMPTLESRGHLNQQWRAFAEKISQKRNAEIRQEKLLKDRDRIKDKLIGEARDSEKDDVESVRAEDVVKGITLLSQWLSTSSGEDGEDIVHARSDAADSQASAAASLLRRSSAVTTILLMVAVLLTIVVTYLSGAVGLLGTIPVAFLIWRLYILITKSLALSESTAPSQMAQIRTIRENDFLQTGLKPPKTWQTRDVTDRLQQLIALRYLLQQRDMNQAEIYETEDRIKRIQRELMQIEETINPIRDSLAGQLYFEEQHLSSPMGLYDIVQTIQIWQQKRSNYMGKIKQIEQSTHQFDKITEEFHAILHECISGSSVSTRILSHLNPTNDPSENDKTATAAAVISNRVRTAFEMLKKSVEEVQTAQKNLDDAKRECYRLRSDLNGLEQQKQQMAKRLKTTTLTVEKLQTWSSQLPNYRNVMNSLNELRMEVAVLKKQAKKRLKDDVLLEKWLQLDQQAAEIQRDEKKERADKYEEISNEIVAIQEQLKNAGNSTELQTLVNSKNDALMKLEDAYEANIRSIAGDKILKLLKKELDSVNMPPVFAKAKELFSNMTNGRYDLGVEMGGEDAFCAIDLKDKTLKQIDQLSTGTKIQLLMAVRLAFIEESEQGLKLPVLVDELLANSDDKRSAAIIDALCEISRTGRQVFYFTAQEEEVQRWKNQVVNSGVQLKEYELA